MSASFAAAAAWGLIVVAAFIGWGGELAGRVLGRRDVDAGLRAAWGMSLTLFLGGLVCLFGMASRALVFAYVAAGVVMAILQWTRRTDRVSLRAASERWHGWPGLILLFLCGALAVLNYLLSIDNLRFQVNDDLIAYFPFARQILDAGTLFDPFSTRRVMSFGGQSLLHALVLAGAPQFRLHMFDEGICLLIGVLLIAGDTHGTRRRWPLLVALLVLITLPDVRINTYPEMSGVVIFYGLYRTLAWLDDGERPTRGPAAAGIVALVAIAACALRSNYIAVAVPMVALSYLVLWLREKSERGQHFREAMWCAGLALVFLAPWMLLSYRSSGTPLFPLIHGHFNNAFPMLQDPRNLRQQWADLVAISRQNNVFSSFPLIVAAGFLLPDRGRRAPLKTLLVSSLLGWVLLVSALASDTPSFLRYVYGFMNAVALAAITRIDAAVDTLSRLRRTTARLGQATAFIAAAAQLYSAGSWAILSYGWMLRALPPVMAAAIPRVEEGPAWPRYDALQSHVPPGAKLLVMVDFPFLFDFGRNEIYNIDTAAAVSPPPGWPYFQGPEKLNAYLREQSIRYLAFVRPEKAVDLYRRDVWVRHLNGTAPTLWHKQAPYYLDILNNAGALAATHEIPYYDGTLVLVDLGRERSAAVPAAGAAASRRP